MEQSQEEPTKKPPPPPPPPPPLRSSPPAIILRRFEPSPSDATALFSWASDPRVTRFLRRGPVPDSDAALRYITDHILPHPWYRAICVPPSGTPVGSISIKPGPVQEKNTRFRSASVGYRLAHAHWGCGIATAALRAAAAAAFAEWLQLDRLEAVADVENLASQRVLEKAGFRREGVLRKYARLKGEETRDVVMYSLLSTDDMNE
ncbi:putative N-acetyltransferase p20 [Ananas comosus]|uniref:Putative N-acetyltransferase p20 n=1 Tax=Ananas comosus TaxID=4615 RepID=A0A199V5F1_ANACO|nr:putative N-acetyltransferase p20 [Ananas comosus]